MVLLLSGLCINSGLNAMPMPDVKRAAELNSIQVVPAQDPASNLQDVLNKIKRTNSIERISEQDITAGIAAYEAMNVAQRIKTRSECYGSLELEAEQENRAYNQSIAHECCLVKWCKTRPAHPCCNRTTRCTIFMEVSAVILFVSGAGFIFALPIIA